MSGCSVRLDKVPHQARTVLRLQGPDTTRFLQGTVSGDLESAPPVHTATAALLTVKAKIISELVAMRHAEDCIDLLVPTDVHESVCTHLQRHIIMDDVEVRVRNDAEVVAAWGRTAEQERSDDTLCWTCTYPVEGELWVGTSEQLAAAALEVVADEHASREAFARHRVAKGIPAWGAEVRAGFFPPEVGFVRAVSYSKGCFLGQEPLARLHARGQVNRVMVRVELCAPVSAPVSLAHPDRDDAGNLTTAVDREGLAIVRRTFAQPGTRLRAGEAEVVVRSGPLGDDQS